MCCFNLDLASPSIPSPSVRRTLSQRTGSVSADCRPLDGRPLDGRPIDGEPTANPTTARSRRGALFAFAVAVLGAMLAAALPARSATAQTELYVSGTMHIESDPSRWPDPVKLVDFFTRATAAGHGSDRATGMRWSIGADIGWLRNEPAAVSVILATQALGVEWDIHAHNAADRPECFVKIRNFGGAPNRVVSGLTVSEIDSLRRPQIASDGTRWGAQVLWGLVIRAGHGSGSDDRAFGVWRPRSSSDWQRHAPSGSLIAVGGGGRTLDSTIDFALGLAAGTVGRGEPISSATINVAPDTLQVVDTTDGIAEIEAWADAMALLPHVQWATIRETAADWVAAGGVPSRW